MKVSELLTEVVKGNWKIANLTGWEKTFKDEQSPEAQAWMRNRDRKPDREMDKKVNAQIKERDREYARAEREANRKPKVDLGKVYHIVIDAIGNSFPDGDPIDHIIPALKRMGVASHDAMDIADKAMKAHGGKIEKKGVYPYLSVMWDDSAADALHDAKIAKDKDEDYDSPFIDYDRDGNPKVGHNPWKPHRA